MDRTGTYARATRALAVSIGLMFIQCDLFDTREPGDPSLSSLSFRQPTDPSIVISNLQNAVFEKNVANYMSCFVDPVTANRVYTFSPSADGASLVSWDRDDERSHFENLRTSIGENGFSQLTLIQQNTPFPIDTVRYEFQYTLTAMHSKPGVPTTVSGHMELSIGRESSGSRWSIYSLADHKDTAETWSRLKVEFQ